ncbi:MAG: preprotein translocase subunit YajC [Deltaproteobacteria bacterium]|nr:preprotein translocase subunit YajC [Deltaproteobacteria bacterium]
MSPMILMVFLIFYLLVILPQQKQLKMQEALLTSLKKGEMVLTSSGIIARVAGVENDHVLLEISNGVKVKFERSHIKFRVEKKN